MERKRAQSSMELIVFISFSMLILFIFLVAMGTYENSIRYERKSIQARALIWRVSSEINGADLVGDGYSRIFSLPARLPDNTNYTIRVNTNAQTVQIYWGEAEGGYGLPITTSNFTGSFTPGSNNLLTNTQGTINAGVAP